MALMKFRDPEEPHRVSTPLELLFDLCFVVAVSEAASRLHHGVAEGHVAPTLIGFGMVFFAIWWAWMNFTWFASAYDNDDVLYRCLVLLQIVGVLVLAAGVPRALDHGDFGIVTLGYVIMRVGLIALWGRAAKDDLPRRRTAVRYLLALASVQALWIARWLWLGAFPVSSWAVLVACELAVPLIAERAARTYWHPHHIAERYGLFTLIVIGESVLSSTTAIQAALDTEHAGLHLAAVVVGALLIVFSMWWIYFDRSIGSVLGDTRFAFLWGYGHLFVFAATAAIGAGIALEVEHAELGEVGHLVANAALTIPLATYLVTLWALHVRPLQCGPATTLAFLGGAILVLATTLLPSAALAAGIIVSTVLVVKLTAGKTEEMSHEP